MSFSFEKLGIDTNVEVLRRQLQLDGKQVVDIGCGSMTFSKIVAGQGAEVLAIDPDPRQAEVNRGLADRPSGIGFRRGWSRYYPRQRQPNGRRLL